ncbi:DinB family protein [Hymenobacter terricola]|uniref:DinB family protein n=1 Tax=Hymenobacter terricola TaxID=2819236 RepID=UPI001B30C24F|nr:DinB family protein [Hymenobacter terricola]
MYAAVSDFVADWQYEAGATEKVLAALTNESLAQPVSPNGRTLGGIAWHIVQTLTEMPHTAGFLATNELDEQPVPAEASVICETYRRLAQQVASAATANWTDDQLRDMIPMYGDSWPKCAVLSVLIRHQAHHRGQLTVLMRQAGLRVPGVYGPAREDWAEFGVSAPS